MRLVIILPARRIALILGGLAIYLSLHSIIGKHLEWAAGLESTYWLYHFVQLFNVNQEGNIPTWYSTLLLLACAVLVALVAHARKTYGERYVRHWAALSLIFLYLSLDEAAAIHEKLSIPLEEALNLTGYLYFGWVIVGAGILVVFLLIYARFFFQLPSKLRRQFLLAGLLYVGGGLGIEVISANRWYLDDGTSLAFSTIGAIEECLEMLGAVVLIYALLTQLSTYTTEIRVLPGPRAPAEVAGGPKPE